MPLSPAQIIESYIIVGKYLSLHEASDTIGTVTFLKTFEIGPFSVVAPQPLTNAIPLAVLPSGANEIGWTALLNDNEYLNLNNAISCCNVVGE